MGGFCCRERDNINEFTKKLMLLSETPNSSLFKMKILDIEDERVFEEKLMLPIVKSLTGITQINFLNSLYLCGINEGIASNVGSFLLKVSLSQSTTPFSSIMVNSIHPHYSPAIIGWKTEHLFVFGGRKQTECEYYNIKQSKWHRLPSLPEERFKCSLVSDEGNNFIYLFGGYCSLSNSNIKTVLRLDMILGQSWEMIIITEQEGFLARNSSVGLSFLNNSTIYIFGGKDDHDHATDHIVEFDPLRKNVRLSKYKLLKPCLFNEQNGVDLNRNQFDFIDNEGYITKINQVDFKITMMNIEVLLSKTNQL